MSEEYHTSTSTPTVFLSYSHDSREHKQWVAQLAAALMEKGVQVIFDQWDLEPGDDVPKFMERSVKQADRVLMVCTEPYVRKANDGKGGVGYEAMIVTGELVRDLGTRKFVPLIRQSGNTVVPDCVSTRLYVDFSKSEDFEDSLEALVKTIHQVVAASKPALGSSPYASISTPSAATLARQTNADAPFSNLSGNPAMAYRQAGSLASTGDRVGWRRMMKALERQGASELIAWRNNHPNIPAATDRDFAALHEHAALGVRCYAPFFAALVAGAESGDSEFCGQLGWIDEISKPPGWNPEGLTYWHDFPELLLFIGHALIGSMLMESRADKPVYELATTRLPCRWRGHEQKALFKDTSVTGWPNVMLHTCTVAWVFLLKQADEEWVTEAFGSPDHFKSALSAYYQFLSFLNFVSLSAKGRIESGQLEWAVTVPLNFCRFPREVSIRGYRTFLSHRDFLLHVLKENGLDDPEKLRNHWKIWMAECGRWLGGVFQWHFDFEVPQTSLPDDIVAEKLKISEL